MSLKTSQKWILLCLLFVFLFGCEKHPYQSRILFGNKTDASITVCLYTTKEFTAETGHYYFNSSRIGHKSMFLTITMNGENEIYISENQKIDPVELTGQMFDSIFMDVDYTFKKRIKFYPDTVIGYSENLFEKNDFWNFFTREIDVSSTGPTAFSDDFIFEISVDKFR